MIWWLYTQVHSFKTASGIGINLSFNIEFIPHVSTLPFLSSDDVSAFTWLLCPWRPWNKLRWVDSAGKAEADIIVIGSGVGGLCCGGLLARYGQDVLVLESHNIPGGAAHAFKMKGYHFDSGPSLFSGLSSRGPQANPLAQVCSFIPLSKSALISSEASVNH